MNAERTGFTFRGTINTVSFHAFAVHRAERLSLTLELGSSNPQQVQLAVTGAPDLLDAFEMACSLGPYDCLITDIERDVNA